MIPQLHVDPGDEVFLAAESHALHGSSALTMGGIVRRVHLRDFHYGVDDLADAVTSRTKVIWICSPSTDAEPLPPSPQRPWPEKVRLQSSYWTLDPFPAGGMDVF